MDATAAILQRSTYKVTTLLMPCLPMACAEKKKPKKKKKAGPMTSARALAQQTSPPRTPVSTFFKDGVYPEGEIQEYTNEFVKF